MGSTNCSVSRVYGDNEVMPVFLTNSPNDAEHSENDEQGEDVRIDVSLELAPLSPRTTVVQ